MNNAMNWKNWKEMNLLLTFQPETRYLNWEENLAIKSDLILKEIMLKWKFYTKDLRPRRGTLWKNIRLVLMA
jgi:hypothetical protein